MFLGSFPLSKTGMQGEMCLGGTHTKKNSNVTALHCLLTPTIWHIVCKYVTQKKYKRELPSHSLFHDTLKMAAVALIHLDLGQFNPYLYRDHQSTCRLQLKGCLTTGLQYPFPFSWALHDITLMHLLKPQPHLVLHLSFRHNGDTHHCLFTAVEEHIAGVSNLSLFGYGTDSAGSLVIQTRWLYLKDFNLKVYIVLNVQVCSLLVLPASSYLVLCLRCGTAGKGVQG